MLFYHPVALCFLIGILVEFTGKVRGDLVETEFDHCEPETLKQKMNVKWVLVMIIFVMGLIKRN